MALSALDDFAEATDFAASADGSPRNPIWRRETRGGAIGSVRRTSGDFREAQSAAGRLATT